MTVLHELFSALPVPAAYLAGPDLVFEFANDAYQQLVGRAELTGRTLREALPDLAAQGRAELIAAVLESGQPFQGYETELFVRRDAASAPEQIFVECLYQPVRGADGQVDGVLLLVSDVTAQVRDRQEQEVLATQLAATQERYKTLFETLPQGVIYYDTNGLVLGANPAACEILGLDEEEMITWPVVAAGQAVHENGSPLRPGDFPVSVALRTGEVVTDVVLGFQHGRTGELCWLRITAVPDARDENGPPAARLRHVPGPDQGAPGRGSAARGHRADGPAARGQRDRRGGQRRRPRARRQRRLPRHHRVYARGRGGRPHLP